MNKSDFPKDTPHLDEILINAPEVLANGGSCIAGPDGEWLVAPDITTDGNIYHELNFQKIYEERQNFDPAGHYSRPDVTKLVVNRERQSTVAFED
jgi:nitrilase